MIVQFFSRDKHRGKQVCSLRTNLPAMCDRVDNNKTKNSSNNNSRNNINNSNRTYTMRMIYLSFLMYSDVSYQEEV